MPGQRPLFDNKELSRDDVAATRRGVTGQRPSIDDNQPSRDAAAAAR